MIVIFVWWKNWIIQCMLQVWIVEIATITFARDTTNCAYCPLYPCLVKVIELNAPHVKIRVTLWITNILVNRENEQLRPETYFYTIEIEPLQSFQSIRCMKMKKLFLFFHFSLSSSLLVIWSCRPFLFHVVITRLDYKWETERGRNNLVTCVWVSSYEGFKTRIKLKKSGMKD